MWVDLKGHTQQNPPNTQEKDKCKTKESKKKSMMRPNTKHFCRVFRLNVHCVNRIRIGIISTDSDFHSTLRSSYKLAIHIHFDHMNQTIDGSHTFAIATIKKKRNKSHNITAHWISSTYSLVPHTNFVLFCCCLLGFRFRGFGSWVSKLLMILFCWYAQ